MGGGRGGRRRPVRESLCARGCARRSNPKRAQAPRPPSQRRRRAQENMANGSGSIAEADSDGGDGPPLLDVACTATAEREASAARRSAVVVARAILDYGLVLQVTRGGRVEMRAKGGAQAPRGAAKRPRGMRTGEARWTVRDAAGRVSASLRCVVIRTASSRLRRGTRRHRKRAANFSWTDPTREADAPSRRTERVEP